MPRFRLLFEDRSDCSHERTPRSRQASSSASLASTLFVLASFVGCGAGVDGKYPIEGEVKFQGSPLAKGTVQFVAVDGSSMTGGDVVDGKFAIPADRGAKPGKYVVRISSVDEKTIVEAMPGDAGPQPVSAERIPAAWNVESAETRDVAASGENRFAFEIP